MDHDALMLKCIEQATAQGMKGDEARDEACKMFAQITGRSLDSVRQNARTAIGSGSHRADVRGKDGKFDDYTRDKLSE